MGCVYEMKARDFEKKLGGYQRGGMGPMKALASVEAFQQK